MELIEGRKHHLSYMFTVSTSLRSKGTPRPSVSKRELGVTNQLHACLCDGGAHKLPRDCVIHPCSFLLHAIRTDYPSILPIRISTNGHFWRPVPSLKSFNPKYQRSTQQTSFIFLYSVLHITPLLLILSTNPLTANSKFVPHAIEATNRSFPNFHHHLRSDDSIHSSQRAPFGPLLALPCLDLALISPHPLHTARIKHIHSRGTYCMHNADNICDSLPERPGPRPSPPVGYTHL